MDYLAFHFCFANHWFAPFDRCWSAGRAESVKPDAASYMGRGRSEEVAAVKSAAEWISPKLPVLEPS